MFYTRLLTASSLWIILFVAAIAHPSSAEPNDAMQCLSVEVRPDFPVGNSVQIKNPHCERLSIVMAGCFVHFDTREEGNPSTNIWKCKTSAVRGRIPEHDMNDEVVDGWEDLRRNWIDTEQGFHYYAFWAKDTGCVEMLIEWAEATNGRPSSEDPRTIARQIRGRCKYGMRLVDDSGTELNSMSLSMSEDGGANADDGSTSVDQSDSVIPGAEGQGSPLGGTRNQTRISVPLLQSGSYDLMGRVSDIVNFNEKAFAAMADSPILGAWCIDRGHWQQALVVESCDSVRYLLSNKLMPIIDSRIPLKACESRQFTFLDGDVDRTYAIEGNTIYNPVNRLRLYRCGS